MKPIFCAVAFLLSSLLFSCSVFSQTLYMVGDSTMAIKKAEDYPETGWGQALGLLADKKLTILNAAVNGRSTKSFISEGRWDAVKKALKPGDFVIIQFGHNDQKKKDPTRFTAPFGEYTENLSGFVKDARAAGASPIFATSIVRRKYREDGTLKDTHKDYAVAVRKAAKTLDVPMVDLQRMTEALVLEYGVEPSKALYVHGAKGELKNYPEGVKDDTHLSEIGALKVAKLFVTGLKETDSALGVLF